MMDRSEIRRWLAEVVAGPPPELRERVLANVAQLGRRRVPVATQATPPGPGPVARGGLLPGRMLVAAAALAVLAFVAGIAGGVMLGPRPADEGRLGQAAMMMAELARQPGASAMTLRDQSGQPGGTVIYDSASRQLAVFSESLPPGAADYDCFVERNGERVWIGPMHFEANTHFWAGPLWAGPTDLGRTGDRFIVLASADDPVPMLEADF